MYALAYNNNQNKVLESNVSNSLHVIDRRNTVMLPTTFEDNTISTFFNLQSTPTNNWWSGIAVKGWSGEYGVWMLAGPAAGDNAGNRLYYKDGNHSNWATDWKGLAFLDDISNLGDVYFNGQNIYNDYGHWVVGLIRIGTADIGDKYISGEMIYRRSNGIYGNGSVRFNLIKKYQTTSMFAGVLYVGYGINTDQDAPRLCTFTYQGVKWGGLCWRSAASLNSIKTIIYDNSSTDTPFYVRYYNSQSGEVQNTEINNSISVLGSDIDIFPISSNGKFYTSSGRMDIHSAGNDWAYMRYTTDGRFYDIGLSSSRNPGSAMNGETGNFEIRPDGSSSNGIFVRYSNSSYGRLGVVSRSTQECSISYWNNAPTSNYPLWTVGAGIRNQYSFDWYYHNQGYKATLDSEGKLFVNVRVAGNPYCSLTIGDYDTGFHWESDGIVSIYCNAAARGGWQVGQFRYGHGYLKEATGNDYHTLGIMVNGNGTANTIKPGIGFHQPGVYANSLRSDGPGDFRFCVQGGTIGCQVQAGSFYANGGLIYSNANGCQAAFGSQNVSYVHITNNANRAYYMDHTLHISGDVAPYTNEGNALGNSSKWWGGIYGKEVYVSGWVRFTGASGVYWTAYSGGWTMNDATYIRSYGGKSLWIEGSIIANGEVTAYSDIRLKSNIKPLDYKGRLAPK